MGPLMICLYIIQITYKGLRHPTKRTGKPRLYQSVPRDHDGERCYSVPSGDLDHDWGG